LKLFSGQRAFGLLNLVINQMGESSGRGVVTKPQPYSSARRRRGEVLKKVPCRAGNQVDAASLEER